ncbi:MAG: fumarylacetoacetate hydrolase family protein [Gammaproteobacteria bacterium]|nr:fumarylacetoacetate hydrolase family protein [Gammaproteobacteria bacterium]MDE2251471.1 fumarylacetoacetate hydrolase family protein [Gammaproteobacteria bacterium]
MKLASLKQGRDGRLVVVSRDLARCVSVPEIAATMQQALDRWESVAPKLREVARELDDGSHGDAFPAGSGGVAAPLPRGHHWVDGSAYVNHVELVRKARGAQMPPSFWTDPLVYQGGADDFLGPVDDARFPADDLGIDLEGEVAVITGDVPMATTAEQVRVRRHIRLLMLVNDWTLRNLTAPELAKGFGFYQSKPATAFSPVAVTPDELGPGWDGAKALLPLHCHVNGRLLGAPLAGVDMTFDFPALIAHCTRTRNLGAGTIVGSGTVSNLDRSRGSSCLAEQRMLEVLATGQATTPFLRFGDRVRIEMLAAGGASVFGAIDQRVARV